MKATGTFFLGMLILFFAVAERGEAWSLIKKTEETSVRKTVVMLYDLSESTKPVRETYLETFKKVLPSITHGDVIVAAKITEASIRETEIPIQAEFPPFVAKDPMGRVVKNKLLVDSKKKEADERLEKEKEALVCKAEEVFKQGTQPDPKKKGRKILNTDVLSSLKLAQKIFKSYPGETKVLVILSDMIEDSANYNFDKEKLTDKRIAAIIKTEKDKNALPDMAGVKVYVVAAGVKTSKKFLDVQKFWLAYFKECGADLAEERYGPVLLAFHE